MEQQIPQTNRERRSILDTLREQFRHEAEQEGRRLGEQEGRRLGEQDARAAAIAAAADAGHLDATARASLSADVGAPDFWARFTEAMRRAARR